MNKIIFSADSTADLSAEIIKENEINIIPLRVILGNDEHIDGVTLQASEIYGFVEKTGILPRTSAINESDFAEHFDKIRGGDKNIPIIHFSISAELSCCSQNAKLAAADTENVYVIDGRALSTGTSLMMLKAIDMAKDGKSVEEIVEFCSKSTDKVQTSFVVDDLLYLYKGGRCKGLTMYAAKVLKIHPMLQIHNGVLKQEAKMMGSMKMVITKYIKYLVEQNPNPDTTRCFITHTDMDDALVQHAIALTKEYFNFETIYETSAGATIASHCGQGTLGLLFMNK
ncbi:MAG: DegV family protein [Clostridia bacterium]|nr:DegV family protein [Clostridia bacterium]